MQHGALEKTGNIKLNFTSFCSSLSIPSRTPYDRISYVTGKSFSGQSLRCQHPEPSKNVLSSVSPFVHLSYPQRLMEQHPNSEEYYTCGKCRNILFYRAHVMHEGTTGHCSDGAGVSQVKEQWGARETTYKGVGGKCSSVFTSEMPEWAEGAAGNDGRLMCPKCSARVGSFSWSGAPCSCGKWVTPAFQFQLSRVDPKGIINIPTAVIRDATGKDAPRPS